MALLYFLILLTLKLLTAYTTMSQTSIGINKRIATTTTNSFTIKGKMTQLPATYANSWLYLFRLEQSEVVRADSSKMDKDGNFLLKASNTTYGQYYINLQQTPTSCDFIFSPQSGNNFSFNASFAQYYQRQSKILNGGVENEAFYELLKQTSVLKKSPTGIPYLLTELTTANSSKLQAISKKYPNTFTAKAIIPTQNVAFLNTANNNIGYTDSASFALAHFLDNISVTDALSLNTRIYYVVFRENYLEKTPLSSYKQVIDYLDRLSQKAPPIVRQYFFKNLLGYYIIKRHNEGAEYALAVFSNEANTCSADDNVTKSAKKMAQYVKCLNETKEGATAYNFSLLNINNQTTALIDAVKKAKVNVVFFWATNCPHCHEFIPYLKECLNKYTLSQVNVTTIATDKTEAEWRGGTNVLNSNWTNLYANYEKLEDIRNHIPAFNTPYVMLIGNNGKILSRMIQPSELPQQLSQFVH